LKSSGALNDRRANSAVTAGSLVSGPSNPPSNPPPNSGGKCSKRGVAYTFPNSADMSAGSNKLTWWYNWGANPAPAETNHAGLGIEFVPMIWGQNTINSNVPQNSKFVLGFNEPNFMVQSNLNPSQAASLWPNVVSSIRGAQSSQSNTYKTVSPALNYCGPASSCIDTDPFAWYDQFFAACQGCQIDHIAAHWYGCTADALTNYLSGLKKYNKKIWITEFSCAQWDPSWQNSVDFQIQYMKDAVSILENDPMVYRYAWFSGRTGDIPNVDLFGNTGSLTDLGNQYFSQPCGNDVSMAIDGSSQNAPDNTQSPSTVSPLVIGLSVGGAVLLIVIVAAIVVFVPRMGKKVETA